MPPCAGVLAQLVDMGLLDWIGLGLTLVAAGYYGWIRLRFFLHVLQLEGYSFGFYRKWLAEHRTRVLTPTDLGMALLALGAWWTPRPEVALLVGAGLSAYWISRAPLYRRSRQKKPLVYTWRLRRLLSVSALLLLLTSALVPLGQALLGLAPYWGTWLPGLHGALLAIPALVYGAAWLLKPLEHRIQEGFKRRARAKLADAAELLVIGITGSYGKTSTKFILAELLKSRFHVLATPGSYNTPMGICKVINEQLSPHHQVLILEMGARYPGNIRELCAIARPRIGVLTALGVAHLETFGSVEAIRRTKYELIEALPEGGMAVFNVDYPALAEDAARTRHVVVRTVSSTRPEADYVAREIRYGPWGTEFELLESATGVAHTLRTRLLGRHNVTNILLAVAVARHLGVEMEAIRRAVARLEPVPHRLQLIERDGVYIIDDAFNSNPVGARNALEILGQFRTGRRFVVTPGMVELGPEEASFNRELGRIIAQNADEVLLIGSKRAQPIREGLEEVGFPKKRVRVFRNLFEANEHLRQRLRPGDVVLYENDLPDIHEEP
ncbi:MAG: UDP-N-acetylmuramoyl-tripeptide--D-alanyl-D-alanine ligase [Bacteroidota bacterium]|nr:UDP-N-acetylmuramoyl-tripeptide--D-alanyl-D-alanine ligase [Rhodothermia bacterium]MDW8286156.1 UDP-N-acetylmuramoyl-tripeptide--D-alanyl-D-alanine ligase [Bacteroidota bacterium]